MYGGFKKKSNKIILSVTERMKANRFPEQCCLNNAHQLKPAFFLKYKVGKSTVGSRQAVSASKIRGNLEQPRVLCQCDCQL